MTTAPHSRLALYLDLIRWNRPAGWLLLLWPTLAALAPLALGALFYIAIAVVLAQVAWHWWLIRSRTRDGCFRAFRVNHWIGFTLFVGVAGSYALRG